MAAASTGSFRCFGVCASRFHAPPRCRAPLIGSCVQPKLPTAPLRCYVAGLAKIYCCRRDAATESLPAAEPCTTAPAPFPAFDDDDDAWVKARWQRSDVGRVLSAALDAARVLPRGGGGGIVEVEMELQFGASPRTSPPRPAAGEGDSLQRAVAIAGGVAADTDAADGPSDLLGVGVCSVRPHHHLNLGRGVMS